jgi:hypothetical protein
VCGKLTDAATQNITHTLCGAPVRDMSTVTPIVIGISGGVATIAVIIRCSTSDAMMSLDNVFAVAALAAALPISVVGLYMPEDGFGTDVWTLTPSQITRIIKVALLVLVHDASLTWHRFCGSAKSSTC